MSQEDLESIVEVFRTLASWRDEIELRAISTEEQSEEAETPLH